MSLSDKMSGLAHFEMTALPALNQLVSATDRIFSRWPDTVKNPPESDREKLVRQMQTCCEKDDWAGVKMYLVTSAARALFDEERRNRSDLAELRQFYFEECKVSTRPSFLNAMFSVYFSTYVPGADHTRELAKALTVSVDRLGPRWTQLIAAIPEILDADQAHEALGKLMFEMDDPWTELKRVGLRKPHDAGLLAHAHLAFVNLIRPGLKFRGEMERLLSWLKPDGHETKITGAPEAIEALLGHWVNQAPAADDLTYLTENLISLYGDPRVSRGVAWNGLSEPALNVIMRWLTGENIRFFLDVVSAVEDNHMWAPRKKFWLGLHRQGRIDAAWVAFSPRGAEEARRKTAGSRGNARPGYGHQIAGGTRSNTSLLILQIGRKIVIEGSHNYKVHIFDRSHPKCPKLYQFSYDCEDIRLIPEWRTMPPRPKTHVKPHLSGWEGWVLEHI